MQGYSTYGDDYGGRREGDVSRDEYGQLGARRDEYGRARGYLGARDAYERERLGSPPRQEYGRLPVRDTEDYGRLPPSREDIARESYDYLRRARDLGPTSDDYRRAGLAEQRLEDSRRLAADEYGGRLPRDTYADDKDWRSALVRERTGDQPRDYAYGEPRTVAKEMIPSGDRKPSPYGTSGEADDNSRRGWPIAARESAKDLSERAGDVSLEKRAEEPRPGYTNPTDDPDRRDSGDARRDTAPERYPLDYEGRASSGDSRRVSGSSWEAREGDAADGGYDRPSYRELEERGYSGHESTYDRSSARPDRREQQGYGYERSQRGRGSRGRGGPGMGGRGGPRGYPRKPGFNRPPRQGWKGGQGRY